MNYLKDPKIITIIVLLLVIIGGGLFTQNKITEIDNTYKTEKHYLDSTYKADSVSMAMKYSTLDSQYSVAISRKDSSSYKDSTNSHITKTIIRTIYKDSIKEVYVENNEYVTTSQKTIVSLQDSVINATKKITELDSRITELTKELSVKKIDTITVTKIHEKTITPVAKKFSVYGNIFGKSTQTINLAVGAEVGGDYKIYSPVYIGASIRKDGISTSNGYNALIKAGVKFEF